MDEINLKSVIVSGVKADFVDGKVRISIDCLLKDALPIRDDLRDIAGQFVDVHITKPQPKLPGIFDFPGGEEFAEDIRSGKVEISTEINGKRRSTKKGNSAE